MLNPSSFYFKGLQSVIWSGDAYNQKLYFDRWMGTQPAQKERLPISPEPWTTVLPSIHHLHQKLLSAISWWLVKLVLCKEVAGRCPYRQSSVVLNSRARTFPCHFECPWNCCRTAQIFFLQICINICSILPCQKDLNLTALLSLLLLLSSAG